jgi:hypothetical protein
MMKEYEIFECLPDGSVMWRAHASGLIDARRSLRELTKASERECFAMELANRTVLFPADGPALGKRVFQIAYAEAACKQRAGVLRRLGYGVLSVMGNVAAKNLLTKTQVDPNDIAVFMVGHAAPAALRKEIAQWLKRTYPAVKIIALNPPDEHVATADYNTLPNNPELWLPLVAATRPTLASENSVEMIRTDDEGGVHEL